jgi:hypothetical protein
MIIKLKNAVEEFKGKVFLLNSDIIVSVYESKDDKGNLGTFVYGSNDKTWQVEDTVEQIYKKLSA